MNNKSIEREKKKGMNALDDDFQSESRAINADSTTAKLIVNTKEHHHVDTDVVNYRSLFFTPFPSYLYGRIHQEPTNRTSNPIITDIVPTIFSYCDAASLSRAAVVCREWNHFSRCNQLWENLCQHVFGLSPSEFKPTPDPVKVLYILNHNQRKNVWRETVSGIPFGTRAPMSFESLPPILASFI